MFSQNSKTDSLENLLGKVSGKEKVKVLNELTEEWRYISLKKSLEYNKLALYAAKKINDKKGEADALYISGRINNHSGKYDTALISFKKALSIYTKTNNKIGIMESYNSIAVTYWYISDYKKALSNNKKALEISNEIQNAEGKAIALNNIGLIYSSLGDYDNALKYFIKALKFFEELKSDSQAGVLINIGIIFGKILKENEKALYYYFKALKIVEKKMNRETSILFYNIGTVYTEMEDYEKAVEYLNKALKLYKQFGDKSGIAYIFMNFGIIFEQKGNYKLSKENYLKSEEIFMEINDNYNISLINNFIAEINIKMRNFNESQKNLKKSRIIAIQIGAKDLLKDNYGIFSDLFAAKKDYKDAYEYHKLYFELHDSLYNEETNSKINELEIRYETEKKEKQILFLSKQNETEKLNAKKQKLLKYLFLTGLLLILVTALLLYLNIKQKNKLNKKLKYEKEFLQILMDANPNPQYFKDINGKYIGCNKSFEKITGLNKNEILGKTVADIPIIHNACDHEKTDSELLKNHGTKKYFSSVIIANKQKREFGFIKTVYAKNGKQTKGILGIMVDITQIKKQEELIREQEKLIHEQEKENLENKLKQKEKELINITVRLAQNNKNIRIFLKIISTLNKYSNNEGKKLIKRYITDYNSILKEENWEYFENQFKETYENFYAKLVQNYSQLTKNDLKICLLLYLNLSTKEISEITIKSPRTIENSRVRIRKKLNISGTDEDLSEFLSQL